MTKLNLASLGLAMLACSAMASAATFNYANDFSITNGNPNGAWTYGYMGTLGGPLTLHTTTATSGDTLFWVTDFGSGVPANFKNIGLTPGVGGLLPGEAALHGGADPGAFSVARFTSPGLTGSVTLSGSFGQGDFGDVDVHILKNGVSLFSELGTGDTQPFALTTTLAAGDTIDFVVGRSNSFLNDTTPLDATLIVTVPEPTAAFTGLGFAALTLLRRKRR